MNTKQGIMSNLKMRQAVQMALNEEDMLAAAFGSTDYYTVDGAMYPKGYPWYTDRGTQVYNKGDIEGARKLIASAGIPDRTIRILTSQQYEFHYKMALVAAEYLKQAGFKVDMQVVDWATLTQRRQDPALWDIFITHSPFLPEPALIDFPSKNSPDGGTRRAATRCWTPSIAPLRRKSASSSGAMCSRPSSMKCPSSKWATSTRWRPSPPRWKA